MAAGHANPKREVKGISIRASRPEDLAFLGQLNMHMIQDQRYDSNLNAQELSARFARLIGEGWSVDVLEEGGEVIGYATYRRELDDTRRNASRVFIRQFFVARHVRRSGAGSAGLEQLIRTRFEPGDRIVLDVVVQNPGGQAFWQRTGFKPTAIIMERLVSQGDFERP